MNKARLKKLADVLARGVLPKHKDVGFNMCDVDLTERSRDTPDMTGHRCRTVCCVAGWSNFLHGHDPVWADAGTASGDLDLTLEQSDALFLPANYLNGRSGYTNKQAASVIRHLTKTGEVDWSRFKRDGSESVRSVRAERKAAA